MKMGTNGVDNDKTYNDIDYTLEEVAWDPNILEILSKSYWDPSSKCRLCIESCAYVKNARLKKQFEKRKEEFESQRTAEEMTEIYAFARVRQEDIAAVKSIVNMGIKTNNVKHSLIGDPQQGVCLQKHADILADVYQEEFGSRGYMIIFKLLKGRECRLDEQMSNMKKPPTKGYDCHLSKRFDDSLKDNFRQGDRASVWSATQIYLYEHGMSANVLVSRPRHVIPYAVFGYRWCAFGNWCIRELYPHKCINQLWRGEMQLCDSLTIPAQLESFSIRVLPFPSPCRLRLAKFPLRDVLSKYCNRTQCFHVEDEIVCRRNGISEDRYMHYGRVRLPHGHRSNALAEFRAMKSAMTAEASTRIFQVRPFSIYLIADSDELRQFGFPALPREEPVVHFLMVSGERLRNSERRLAASRNNILRDLSLKRVDVPIEGRIKEPIIETCPMSNCHMKLSLLRAAYHLLSQQDVPTVTLHEESSPSDAEGAEVRVGKPKKLSAATPSKVTTKTPSQVPSKKPKKVPAETPSKMPAKDSRKVPGKDSSKVPVEIPVKVPAKTPNKVTGETSSAVPAETENKAPARKRRKISEGKSTGKDAPKNPCVQKEVASASKPDDLSVEYLVAQIHEDDGKETDMEMTKSSDTLAVQDLDLASPSRGESTSAVDLGSDNLEVQDMELASPSRAESITLEMPSIPPSLEERINKLSPTLLPRMSSASMSVSSTFIKPHPPLPKSPPNEFAPPLPPPPPPLPLPPPIIAAKSDLLVALPPQTQVPVVRENVSPIRSPSPEVSSIWAKLDVVAVGAPPRTQVSSTLKMVDANPICSPVPPLSPGIRPPSPPILPPPVPSRLSITESDTSAICSSAARLKEEKDPMERAKEDGEVSDAGTVELSSDEGKVEERQQENQPKLKHEVPAAQPVLEKSNDKRHRHHRDRHRDRSCRRSKHRTPERKISKKRKRRRSDSIPPNEVPKSPTSSSPYKHLRSPERHWSSSRSRGGQSTVDTTKDLIHVRRKRKHDASPDSGMPKSPLRHPHPHPRMSKSPKHKSPQEPSGSPTDSQRSNDWPSTEEVSDVGMDASPQQQQSNCNLEEVTWISDSPKQSSDSQSSASTLFLDYDNQVNSLDSHGLSGWDTGNKSNEQSCPRPPSSKNCNQDRSGSLDGKAGVSEPQRLTFENALEDCWPRTTDFETTGVAVVKVESIPESLFEDRPQHEAIPENATMEPSQSEGRELAVEVVSSAQCDEVAANNTQEPNLQLKGHPSVTSSEEQKKKRGRPKKVVPEVNIHEHSQEPKKRGRPRKVSSSGKTPLPMTVENGDESAIKQTDNSQSETVDNSEAAAAATPTPNMKNPTLAQKKNVKQKADKRNQKVVEVESSATKLNGVSREETADGKPSGNSTSQGKAKTKKSHNGVGKPKCKLNAPVAQSAKEGKRISILMESEVHSSGVQCEVGVQAAIVVENNGPPDIATGSNSPPDNAAPNQDPPVENHNAGDLEEQEDDVSILWGLLLERYLIVHDRFNLWNQVTIEELEEAEIPSLLDMLFNDFSNVLRVVDMLQNRFARN